MAREGLMGVYMISCSGNNKRYVGMSVSIHNRWRSHLSLLRKGKHNNIHLQRSFDLYGEHSFSFAILEIVKEEAWLLAVEQTFLDWNFRTPERCMNLDRIASTTPDPKSRPHSAESKAKISAANKGLKRSEEYCKKMSAARTGVKTGRVHSAETKAKMSAARMGWKPSDETKARMKAAWVIRRAAKA